MATTVSGEVEVRASPEAVMAVIKDLASYPEWSDVHDSVTVEDDDRQGRPRRARMRVSVMGFVDEQVLEYQWRNHGVSWGLLEGSQQKAQDGRYELTRSPGGTSVHYELAVEPKIPAPGFLVKHGLKKVLSSATTGLKRRVESGA